MAWTPDYEGLKWFQGSVSPMLKGYSITISENGAHELSFPINVKYLGFVESSNEFLSKCRVFLIQFISGEGIQIKTLEAIDAFKPIILIPALLRDAKYVLKLKEWIL